MQQPQNNVAVQFEVLPDGGVRLTHPHSGMLFTVIVLSNEQFDAINKQRLAQKMELSVNLAAITKITGKKN
jgi:hypothetical protein